ncbi:MAG TPA: hypothetical protein VFF13_02290 [archaeon]|nr:hypothetical protein [archaeon]
MKRNFKERMPQKLYSHGEQVRVNKFDYINLAVKFSAERSKKALEFANQKV